MTTTVADLEIAAAQEIAALRAELRAARDEHRSDIAAIGQALLHKAEYHGWCSDYDNAVSDLNDRLHVALPVRQRTYRARVEGYIRVPFVHYVTVTVTGEDEVEDAAIEAMDGYTVDDVVQRLEHAEIMDDLEVPDYEQV